MPEETRRLGGRCPKCGKAVTIGVLSRVEDIADRPASVSAENRVPFKYIVPLREIIGEVLSVGKKSKAVDTIYRSLVPTFGSEFDVLIHVPATDLYAENPDISRAIEKMRRGELSITPGYDGIYGIVHLFGEGEKKTTGQPTLFE